MNISTQITRGVIAFAVVATLAFASLSNAANVTGTSLSAVSAAILTDVSPTRIAVVEKSRSHGSLTTARVHVGTPTMASAKPTARQLARASR